jgi:hypothetical protein
MRHRWTMTEISQFARLLGGFVSRAIGVSSICAALLLGVSADALAQARVSGEPFSVPIVDRLLCRSEPPTPEDSATYRFQFDAVSPIGGKSMIATFDTAGSPQKLLLIVSDDSDVTSRVKAFLVRFIPEADGVLVRHFARPDTDSMQQAQPTSTPLVREELEKSRALALWLWEHRCAKGNEPSVRHNE